MSDTFTATHADSTRRETLVDIARAFGDEEELKKLATENALVSCALALYADGDEVLMSTLSKYLDVAELREDIKHVRHSEAIRKKRTEMRG